MKLRWLSAIVGIPVYIALCLLSVSVFSAAFTAIAAVMLFEILRAHRQHKVGCNAWIAALGLIAPAWPLLHDPGLPHIAWLTAANLSRWAPAFVLLVMAGEVIASARWGGNDAAARVGRGLLCGVWLSLLGALPAIRSVDGLALQGRFLLLDLGAALALVVTFCVWAADSFALFAGKAFGRNKLAPKISPGKTVEGVAGGLVAAVSVGALFGWVLLGNAAAGAAFGGICGVSGPFGDLFESLFKREMGLKDSGGVLPGHGGLLDRFDSMIFAAPLCLLALPWLNLGR